MSSLMAEIQLEADRRLIRAIPTNAEATLGRARREAAALLRSGDQNGDGEPVARVYVCVSRLKEPSGVVGWRYFCLPEKLYQRFRSAVTVVEVHPNEDSSNGEG